MHSTNYVNTLITVATDCRAGTATLPAKPGTIAELQYRMLRDAPLSLTSDNLLLAEENTRKGPISHDAFFAKPQACLRASPLVKSFGWGLYHDGDTRVELVAMGSARYAQLLADTDVVKVPGMRSARG